MDLSDLQTKKLELQIAIELAIQTFQAKTGLPTLEISINSMSTSLNGSRIYKCRVIVVL